MAAAAAAVVRARPLLALPDPWAEDGMDGQATLGAPLRAFAFGARLPRLWAAGVAACAATVAVFLGVQLMAWPPHEDETLALFVGRHDLVGMLGIVLGQRGGAPLHFLLAWLVAHLGGGLVELRVVSLLLAVASVPAIALLVTRLAGRSTALLAAALAAGSWVLLFHGVYGRMYSLFLLTTALAYRALVDACADGGRRRWLVWGAATLLAIAAHPYGGIVLSSMVVYAAVHGRHRWKEALVAFATVAVVAIPLWRTYLVLAGRFEVGVGGEGAQLGSPASVGHYFRMVAGDFSTGYGTALTTVLVLAAIGLVTLAARRSPGATLAVAAIGTPAVVLVLARVGRTASPESRHLIFALPLFALLVATGMLAVARRLGPAALPVVVCAAAALIVGEVAWARHKTPPLFAGEPAARIVARHAASAWLAATARPDDLLFGYDPLYLGAWERSRSFPLRVVPRADPRLALRTIEATRRPIGRGVFVLDASDTSNKVRSLTIEARSPEPAADYATRAFGPFLVIRTREPAGTPARFLELAAGAERLGRSLDIVDAGVNADTVRQARLQLQAETGGRAAGSTSSASR